MKKIYFIASLSLVALFGTSSVHATIHIINAQGTNSLSNAFVPNVTNAVCGDTIKWVLISGTHTTASTSVPVGATPWLEANITPSGFMYVVTVAGTYNYTCHPGGGGHMDASIVVSCPAGIPSNNDVILNVYPNPASQSITIENPLFDGGEYQLYLTNMLGEIIISTNANTQKEMIDISSIPNGSYLLRVVQNGREGVKKVMIIK